MTDPASGDDGTPPPAPGARILLVDDDALSRRLARSVLERAGHHVESVADGESAIAALGAGVYDLVVMDVGLPGIDGCEAVRAIRRRADPARDTPVIGLSAGDGAGDHDRALAAGMDDFIRKPVAPKVLLDAVAACRRLRAGVQAASERGGGVPTAPSICEADSQRPKGAPDGEGEERDLDPVALARLRSIGKGDPSFVGRILDLFFATTPARLAEIRAAVATGDGARLAAVAHPLKSNLSQLGALRAASAAARLEYAGMAGAALRASADLAALEKALDEMGPALARERGGGSGKA